MRVVIETATRVAVGFDVPDAEFLRDADLARSRALTRLGPDLLAPDVDIAAIAARLIDQGPRPLGQALLDQRIAAGIGNVYRSELLFLAGLHPATTAGAITLEAAIAARRTRRAAVAGQHRDQHRDAQHHRPRRAG